MYYNRYNTDDISTEDFVGIMTRKNSLVQPIWQQYKTVWPKIHCTSRRALKIYGRPFFSVPSLIESTTVLSDVHTYLYTYYCVKSLCGIGMRD